MSFFALSDRSSWQAFWVQSAGNSRLYEESFSLFNKRFFAAHQIQAQQFWSGIPKQMGAAYRGLAFLGAAALKRA
jgi:hypothetical protein